MNYCNPYDPFDPYNLLPITALLLMSSNFNPNGINYEKRNLDFSYLNGTACPSNEFQDRLNQEIANAVSNGNVINQLRYCSEPPRYPASKTGECHFDASTKFETDSYASRFSISKDYDTSTLDDEVTVFLLRRSAYSGP